MSKYNEILSDLENKIYQPVYFLTGSEPYYIDKITDYIMENVLEEAEKSFNQTVLYGKDTTIETVINSAKRYPMMANHQVVIVKEAQEMKNIEPLIYYVEQPLSSTLLVLTYKYKKLDKRSKLYKAMNKKGYVFESEAIKDYRLPEWIKDYLNSKKIDITPEGAQLLSENLGNDLNKISNELEKLMITLPKGEHKISLTHIEKNIGLSKDFNTFELQKALSKKDVLKANRIIDYFGKNPKNHPVTLTLSSLYYFFSKVLTYHYIKDKSSRNVAATLKVNPYFVDEYKMAARNYPLAKLFNVISYLRDCDIKSKGIGNVSLSDKELLKELVFKIMH